MRGVSGGGGELSQFHGVYGIMSNAIWAIWPQLGVFHRLFWLVLTVAGIYTVAEAGSIIFSLRKIGAERPSLRALSASAAKLGHLTTGMFYLFGFVFFWQLPDAARPFGLIRKMGIGEILGGFQAHFAFAANVFVVLLVMHGFHWFASARVVMVQAHSGGTDQTFS